jgi:hypothetical protein
VFPCLPVWFYIIPVSISRLSHTYSCPADHTFLDLFDLIFSSKKYKSRNSSLSGFLEPPVTFFFLSCNIFFGVVIALYQDLTHLNQKTKQFIFIVSFVFLHACGKTKISGPNVGRCGCNMYFYYPWIIFQSDDLQNPKFVTISKDLFPVRYDFSCILSERHVGVLTHFRLV